MALTIVQVKNDLEESRPSFDEMNLNKVDFAQQMEFAIQAFTANPYLLTLDPASVKKCLVNVALTGTTLNPVMKFAYLVPRKGKCCLELSYIGMIKVITDTGSVQSIIAKVVFENEPFEIELGSGGYVKHSICKTGNKGKRIGAYSIAVLNDGSHHIEWMYEDELMGIMKRSESVKAKKLSPWDTDQDEMCRKTVVKRHWKYLPKSERAQMAAQAIAIDDDNNGIDFEKERLEAEKKAAATAPAGATPDVTPEALATEEDINELRELLNDEQMPTIVFETVNKLNVLKNLNTRYDKGELVKSKADEYLANLRATLAAAKNNPAAGITPNQTA